MKTTTPPAERDTMMEELREIRDGISEHLSQLTVQERVAYYDRQLESYAQDNGLNLEPDPEFPRALRVTRDQ